MAFTQSACVRSDSLFTRRLDISQLNVSFVCIQHALHVESSRPGTNLTVLQSQKLIATLPHGNGSNYKPSVALLANTVCDSHFTPTLSKINNSARPSMVQSHSYKSIER